MSKIGYIATVIFHNVLMYPIENFHSTIKFKSFTRNGSFCVSWMFRKFSSDFLVVLAAGVYS